MKKRLKLGLNLFNPLFDQRSSLDLNNGRQSWVLVRMSDIKLFARITISHLLLGDVTILGTRDLRTIMKWSWLGMIDAGALW